MTLEDFIQLATKYRVARLRTYGPGETYEFELHPSAFPSATAQFGMSDFPDLTPQTQPIGAEFGNPTEDEILFYSTVQQNPKPTDPTGPGGDMSGS